MLSVVSVISGIEVKSPVDRTTALAAVQRIQPRQPLHALAARRVARARAEASTGPQRRVLVRVVRMATAVSQSIQSAHLLL